VYVQRGGGKRDRGVDPRRLLGGVEGRRQALPQGLLQQAFSGSFPAGAMNEFIHSP